MYNVFLQEFQKHPSLYEIVVGALIAEVPAIGAYVDCGAHMGVHTKTMIDKVDSAPVVAIEAIPELAAYLRKTLCSDSRLRVIEAAVSREDGWSKFNVAVGAKGYSGIRPRENVGVEGWREIDVAVVSLDSIVKSEMLEHVGLIKADLEGGEFDALRGAEETLKRDRPFVVFENGLRLSANLYGYSEADFFDFFTHIDYCILDFFGNLVTPKYWRQPLQTYMFVATPRHGVFSDWYHDIRQQIISDAIQRRV